MRALPRPLITGVVLAGISWFGFRNREVVLGVFSICSSTALVISAACLRWQREGRFAGRGKCVTMAVVTAVLALGSTLLVLLMSEEYCGNIIPKILLYVFPSAAGAACAYVIFLVTRRDRIAPCCCFSTCSPRTSTSGRPTTAPPSTSSAEPRRDLIGGERK